MINKPMIGVAAAVVAVAAGTLLYLHSRHAALPPAAVAPAQPPAESPAEPATLHPVPAAADSAANAPLPALADSDAALGDAVSQVIGASAVKDYLLPENIIRHLVVTI